jgi:hypothetical protein
MRLLYVGGLRSGQTSLYRYRALQRLGQDLIPFDMNDHALRPGKLNAIADRFPMGPLIVSVNIELLKTVRRQKPEVIWFDRAMRFTPRTIRKIKSEGIFTISYNQDPAFYRNPQTPHFFYQHHKILKMLDLHCLFRGPDLPRYEALGVQFIQTQFSYDSEQQFPPPEGWSDQDRTREVSFIGGPFDDRAQFLRQLFTAYKLPVSISGPRWHKMLSPAEQVLYQRGAMLRDHEYRENIWKSKINLSFITQNGDDVAHKAFEITACGGFLLALRSPRHLASFVEGKEAEFFSTVEECAQKCRYYLDHPAEREAIARRGCQRAHASGYDNDSQLARILQRARELRSAGKYV